VPVSASVGCVPIPPLGIVIITAGAADGKTWVGKRPGSVRKVAAGK